MNNKEQNFKEIRIQYINNWPNGELFEAEKKYFDKYNKSIIKFKTYPYEVNEDKNYNIVISNIMDALDNMPARPELAFDFYWKALDNIIYTVSEPTKTSKEQLQDMIRYLNDLVSKNNCLQILFNDYFECLPERTSKYLYKKLFQGYDSTKPMNEIDKSIRQIHCRLGDYEKSSEDKIKSIINYLSLEFGYSPNTNFQNLRDGWRFIQKLLLGETLTLKYSINDGNQMVRDISLSFEERLNFFVNGILYTFRNDRFHGNLISPFRTSKTTFETYLHPTYCLVLVDFILLLLLEKSSYTNIQNILVHSKNNLEYYKEMFD